MGVHSTHLVLEALQSELTCEPSFSAYLCRTHLGHTGNHVLNETLDCTEASNVFPATLPYRQGDLVGLARKEPDVHINVADILRQGSPGALDGNLTGLYGDLDSLGNVELLGLENVLHLRVRDR